MATMSRKFEDIFKIATKTIKLIGAHPNSNRNIFWKVLVLMGNLFMIACLGFIFYSILFYDLPNKDYAECIKNGIMGTVGLMTITKYNILIYHGNTFKKLLKIMDQDVIESENYAADEREIVATYLKRKVRAYQIWGTCATITCSVFPLKSFILMIYYTLKKDFRVVPIFDFTLPGLLNKVKYVSYIFTVYQSIEFFFDVCAWFVALSFDNLAPIFLLHCCGELQILRVRLIKTFSNESDPNKILQQLKDINYRLQAIYRFVSYLQNIFMILYELVLKITVVLVSFSGFQVMQGFYKGEIALEFLFFFLTVSTQFYLPCYYSDLLMETGDLLRDTIYSCGWEMKSDIRIRKTVLFMLTRTKSPIVLSALFVPISLDTFAETCRQSYTIYNLLMAVD